MKKIFILCSTLALLFSCTKKEKEDLDSMIQYRIYYSLTPTNDTLFAFYIPSAFTPNGDGRNDVFLGKGTDIDSTNFEMSIFYRSGNKIFYNENYRKGWDGRANDGNDLAPVGTYNYKFKLKDRTGESHEYIGALSLLK